MAKVLAVSRGGYYAWLSRKPSRHAREKARLDVEIKSVYKPSKGGYGSVNIFKTLMIGCDIDTISEKRVS